jgi:sugar phosphate isomerase/epimerase
MKNDNYEFGISSFKETDWVGFIKQYHLLGFTHFELKIFDINENANIFNDVILKKINDYCENNNLTLSLHCIGGINISEKLERLRKVSVDILAETLQVAEYLKAKWVTVHLGACGFNNIFEKKINRIKYAVESIDIVLNRTISSNVKLAIENLPYVPSNARHCFIGDSLVDMQWISANTCNNERVYFLFDVGHALIQTKMSDIEILHNSMSEKILAYHLHWNNFIDDLHEEIYTSDYIKISHFISLMLRQMKYKAIPIFECFCPVKSVNSCISLKKYLETSGEGELK